MSESEDFTPIDRPLMRSDLNDVKKAVHDISETTIAMYDEFKGVRSQFRTYVAICVACSFFCIVAAVVSVAAGMAHASSRVVVAP